MNITIRICHINTFTAMMTDIIPIFTRDNQFPNYIPIGTPTKLLLIPTLIGRIYTTGIGIARPCSKRVRILHALTSAATKPPQIKGIGVGVAAFVRRWMTFSSRV